MPHQPTLVFIPGSWHSPSCYDSVIERLSTSHGLKCQKVTLPSTSGDRNAGFKDDLDAARTVVKQCFERGENVVVIAHSYGGMVGSSVIKGMTASDRDTTTQGCTIGLILITTGFAITGLTFMDPFLGIPPPAWKKNTTTGFAEIVQDPSELFYHDLDADEAAHWVSELRPQSLKALFEGGEHVYSGWKDVPSVYIGALEDRGMPNWAQRLQVGMARGQGADVIHHELQSSHSPFLSRPDDVTNIIVDAVKAFEKRTEDTLQVATRRDLALIKLWPRRWMRSGMLVGIGEMIGRVIFAFGRFRRSWQGAA